jgi:cob(I)alamin adenosyltransferase
MIFTGRYCSSEITAKADLVTEMLKIKHYYQNGMAARKGIESQNGLF